MVNLTKNSIHTVTIHGYSTQGMGVGRIDDMVVFVKGAVKGETCRVKLIKVLKNMCFAIIEEILTTSENRTVPDCDCFRLCGGCDFRHITYEEECTLKIERVNDTLRRIGGLEISVDKITGSEEIYHYRNKAQYFFAGGYEVKAGFYRSGSHDVIDSPKCLIQDPRADICKETVKNWCNTFGIPAYDEKRREGIVRYLQVRTGTGGTLVTVVVTRDKVMREKELVDALRAACPDIAGIVLNVNNTSGNVIMGEKNRVLWGDEYVVDTMCSLEFRISPHSFYQINRPQAERLYAKAAEYLELTGDETVIDLYCGIGTIGLSLAHAAGELIGVEIVPQAVEDAAANAERNGIKNAAFICGDAGYAAKKLALDGKKPDVIIVDPPRKGLSKDVIEAILAMAPQKVVYISCDPATLARDLKELWQSGAYTAEKAEAFDLFPRCAHVESICLLMRND